MKTNNVVVTGANGLLGTSLVKYLEGSLTLAAIPRGTDLSESVDCNQILESLRPNTIINLAALTNVDECESFPIKATRINADIVQNLSHWAKNNQARLIQISTDMVYDSPGLNREDQVKIVNEYAKSKLAGEVHASECNGLVLRTNFFGHSENPQRKSFSDWLLESFEKKLPLKLLTDVEFSPLNIRTLCRVIGSVLDSDVSGVFNLGAKGFLSKRDFAYRLADLYGFDIRAHSVDVTLRELALKAPRPQFMAMNVEKFESTFKIALPSLEEEILELKVNGK